MGSAAISIAAASRRLAQSYHLNDKNKPLADLLELIIESPVEISSFYEALWNQQHGNSLEHYYQIREEFNRSQDPRLFLYLLSRCVKGSVRYNSEGLFNQSPDKRRHGARPALMRSNILGVSALLKGRTTFSSKDYRESLMQATPEDLIYMDPPYQGVCGERDSRYLSGIQYHEFVDALRGLNSQGISYIVSYDGRTNSKTFGERLPDSLHLTHVELEAGRSTQATLLGRKEITFESLYISPSLMNRLKHQPIKHKPIHKQQYSLLENTPQYA